MIEPIGEKLLIDPIPVAETTSGGILLPDSSRAVPDKGVVKAVGDGVKEEKLQQGVTIFFRKDSGTLVKDSDGKEYIILPVVEVVGILKEKGGN